MNDFDEETRQITSEDGFSFNESVVVIWTTMTTGDGKLRRMSDGDIMPFDFIWNDVLEMESDDLEAPESRIRAIMMRRFEELKLEHPDKTAVQVLARFRQSSEELYNVFLKGIMEKAC
jgi:hypothetical protein